MSCKQVIFLLLIASLASLSVPKPIMVSFGTNNGSITPLDTSLTTRRPVNINDSRKPAPVFEATEDIPNPNVYRPLVPHQYRSKIYSFKPKPNLILGTPIDRKYTPSIEKYNLYRKQQAKSVGTGYTGPHLFEVQPYEFESQKIRPTVRTSRPQQLFQPAPTQQPIQQTNAVGQSKYVPQIGILYSSGVRYYVPQVFYNYDQGNNGEDENSVYDKNDDKHVYYQQKQKY